MSSIPQGLSAYSVLECAAEYVALADDLQEVMAPHRNDPSVSIKTADLATLAALLKAAAVIIEALVTSLEIQDPVFALPPLDAATAWVPNKPKA